MALAQPPLIYSLFIFLRKFVRYCVAFVVETLTNQPTKDMKWVVRIGDARILVLSINGQDVVFGDRTPVRVAIKKARPPLNDCKQPFYPRTKTVYAITVSLEFVT